ncbi:cytidylate kinase-like family protein [Roseburia sp. 831b]|uniref:cytidylate kinase-like family protein n=1 Tax=Roseburia sp. 831b TaxID=1261635 RepID=UPI000951BB67|nr:cytidylate kinase-like family protein [Roseburia sp. 831b]WVK72381.1 cytidylate kinase-like family protein [Roseburia sp. 831b]
MENNRENCYEIAKQIYHLDEEVYKCVGSSLGRTYTGDEATCVENITKLLITRPQGHEIRSEIALIGNMARTIKNKEDHHRMMKEYNDILKKVEKIPSSFGSVDIINENLAALNSSNLRQHFSPEDHLIICIGRTHGSAGTDIGFALADKLKINYYDAEIFKQVLKRLDAEKEQVVDHSDYKTELREKIHKNTNIGKFFENFNRYHGLPTQDAIFFNQSDLICEMAKKEDFIVMGRCADVVLTNHRIPHISIFITASFEQRVHRMMELHNLNYKQAVLLLTKLDRKHERYYRHYTGKKWGDAVNYDLCINSASYGIEESVELIERMINQYPNHDK